MSEARKVYAVPILPPVLVGSAENLLDAELLVITPAIASWAKRTAALMG